VTRYFIEIWESDEGSLLDTLRSGPGTTEDIISVDVVDEVNGIQELTLKVARSKVTPAHFAIGNIARLVNDTKTGDPYTSYRIKTNKDSQPGGKKAYLECVCEHMKYDLQDVVITENFQFIQTAADDILDYILTTYASDWSRGTITDGSELWDFDLEFGETVYDCIKRFSETLGLEAVYHATGTDAGHDADWYDIDILTVTNTINGTPGTLALSTETNVKSVNYDKDIRDNFATRIYAAGGGCNVNARIESVENKSTMTVETAEFIVKDYDAGVITFYSKNLLIEDDALNGFELYCLGPTGSISGIPIAISDSAKTSDGDKVTTSHAAWSTPPVEGDRIVFYDGLNALTAAPNAVKETAYWPIATTYSDSAFEDYINLAGPIGRSDLSGTYTYGICAGWGEIGSPASTEDTTADYIKNGTKTQKVIADAGEGVYRTLQHNFSDGEKITLSFYVWLTVTDLDAGAYVDAKIRYGATKIVPLDGLWVKGETDKERIISSTFATPCRVLIGGLEFEKQTGYDPRLEITAEGGGATFYVDSVCVVRHPVPLGRERFISWDSRAKLWEDAVIDYNSRIALPNDFSAEIMDIYHIMPTTNSAYEFEAGDSCTLVASRLDLDETARITKKSFNAFDPVHSCRVDFSIGSGKTAKASKRATERNSRAAAKNDYNYLRAQNDLQAGFESILFEDSNGNVTKQGRAVNRGLTNGAWVENRRVTWNQGRTS
jgi:hypothetical protein